MKIIFCAKKCSKTLWTFKNSPKIQFPIVPMFLSLQFTDFTDNRGNREKIGNIAKMAYLIFSLPNSQSVTKDDSEPIIKLYGLRLWSNLFI